MKVLVNGRIYFDEYGESWLDYAYVDLSWEDVEEFIYYAEQERQAVLSGFSKATLRDMRFSIADHHLMADIADFTRMLPYYGGPGRIYYSSPIFRFLPSVNRVLVTQFGGYDI